MGKETNKDSQNNKKRISEGAPAPENVKVYHKVLINHFFVYAPIGRQISII